MLSELERLDDVEGVAGCEGVFIGRSANAKDVVNLKPVGCSFAVDRIIGQLDSFNWDRVR